jgi:hypothetical protein
MARDDRSSTKVRDLEGLIRHYRKELNQAKREISRLTKMLDRYSAGLPVEEPEETTDSEGFLIEPKKEKKLKCDKCKEGTFGVLKLTDVRGREKAYLVCGNPRCGHRKVAKNVQEN